MRQLCALLGAFILFLTGLTGCEADKVRLEKDRVETFKVEILKIESSGKTYQGSEAGRDSASPLPIPLQTVKVTLSIAAYDKDGEFYANFNRPVSFRVTPGEIKSVKSSRSDLSDYMLAPMSGGLNDGDIVVEIANVYGPVVLWVQDAPPAMVYDKVDADDGEGTAIPFTEPAAIKDWPEAAPYRTYAAGATRKMYFGEPNIIDMQRMDEYNATTNSACAQGIANCTINNRTSAFVSNFVTIHAMEPQECMVVTAITNAGFYVTDLSAHYADMDGDKGKRLQMEPYQRSLSHFGHLFVYNFSYPDDLQLGDCIKTITGTVQEFSGNTQVTFPSWTKNDRYVTDETLIPEPMEMVFDINAIAGTYCPANTPETDECFVDSRSNGYRLCVAYKDRASQYVCKPDEGSSKSRELLPCTTNGVKNNHELEFVHCAHNWRNFDAESLESSLIKFTNVKPSNEFQDCDKNGNGVVGFFNYQSFGYTGLPDDGTHESNEYGWFCSKEEFDEDDADCECFVNCSVGYDPDDPDRRDRICTELNSFESYGQWIIELEDVLHTRINLQTGTAIPQLDPRVFDKNAYPECRLNVTGILSQTQAARPRWIIMARDSADVCASSAEGTCPEIIAQCE